MRLIGASLLLTILSKSKGQINYKVFITKGTSESNCDFGDDDAVFGAGLEGGTFTLFHGEGYDCPAINPNEAAEPITLFSQQVSCQDQKVEFSVCLVAGDHDGRGCDVTVSDLDCSVSGCSIIELGPHCFKDDCSLTIDHPFNVVGEDDVKTIGVEFQVTRSGNCGTGVPTETPTIAPTRSPLITPKPTKFPTFPPSVTKSPTKFPTTASPTFPCSGTLDACGGGPGYVGPNCCIDEHYCFWQNSTNAFCRIVTSEDKEDHEQTNKQFGYVAGAIGAILVVSASICFLHSKLGQSRKDAAQKAAIGRLQREAEAVSDQDLVNYKDPESIKEEPARSVTLSELMSRKPDKNELSV